MYKSRPAHTRTGTILQPGQSAATNVTPLASRGGKEAQTDNALLAALAGGDNDAFALLMERHLATTVMLAQRMTFDRDLARDIAQEAFLRVWKHAESWDPYGSATFLTWLRRITINLAISQRRKQREQAGIEEIENMPSGLADGFDTIAVEDGKRVAREALRQLPERQRAAVALYYFDELPQIEAAAAMQMTPRAFDSLIVRARANLKKYLRAAGLYRQEDLP